MAPGPADIFTFMLGVAEESGLTELTYLANMMYKEGCLGEEMNKSIFLAIRKVSGTAKCEKYRMISLMIHVTKLLLRVLMNRVRGRTRHEISAVQYSGI